MAESEMIIGELSSYCAGGLRLRDGDILVVKSDRRNTSIEVLGRMRKYYEGELVRLGVADPKVLTIPSEVSIATIERS